MSEAKEQLLPYRHLRPTKRPGNGLGICRCLLIFSTIFVPLFFSLPSLRPSRARSIRHCEQRFYANPDGLVPTHESGRAGRSRRLAKLLQPPGTYIGRPPTLQTRRHPKRKSPAGRPSPPPVAGGRKTSAGWNDTAQPVASAAVNPTKHTILLFLIFIFLLLSCGLARPAILGINWPKGPRPLWGVTLARRNCPVGNCASGSF